MMDSDLGAHASTVAGIAPLLTSGHLQAIPQTAFRFEPLRMRPRDMPMVEALRDMWIPGMQEQAHQAGRPFFNEECVDIVRVRRSPAGTLVLTPAPMEYYDFAASTFDLDRDAPADLDAGQRTLRQLWGGTPRHVADISGWGAPVKMGVSCTVLSADGFLVQGIRSSKTVNGGGTRLRPGLQSVSEGVLPTDLGTLSECIDPLAVALRGLSEELDVTADQVHWVETVGVYFDHRRGQLCFACLSQVDHTLDQLRDAHARAVDGWESSQIVGFDFATEDAEVLALLRGDHPAYVPATNHSAAALWFTLCWRRGEQSVKNALSLPATPELIGT